MTAQQNLSSSRSDASVQHETKIDIQFPIPVTRVITDEQWAEQKTRLDVPDDSRIFWDEIVSLLNIGLAKEKAKLAPGKICRDFYRAAKQLRASTLAINKFLSCEDYLNALASVREGGNVKIAKKRLTKLNEDQLAVRSELEQAAGASQKAKTGPKSEALRMAINFFNLFLICNKGISLTRAKGKYPPNCRPTDFAIKLFRMADPQISDVTIENLIRYHLVPWGDEDFARLKNNIESRGVRQARSRCGRTPASQTTDGTQ